jgi:DNA-directed RNA polymerase subunit RPC12/RpoP
MTQEHIKYPQTQPHGMLNGSDYTAPQGTPVGERVAGAKLATKARPGTAPVKGDEQEGPKDSLREIVETVVFVVVLVLILKAFIAEAFVIPTGSMATTLLGYHKKVVCPECGYHFRVNCSKEVDLQEMQRAPIVGCTCPNCRFHIDLERRPQPGLGGGMAP